MSTIIFARCHILTVEIKKAYTRKYIAKFEDELGVNAKRKINGNITIAAMQI